MLQFKFVHFYMYAIYIFGLYISIIQLLDNVLNYCPLEVLIVAVNHFTLLIHFHFTCYFRFEV